MTRCRPSIDADDSGSQEERALEPPGAERSLFGDLEVRHRPSVMNRGHGPELHVAAINDTFRVMFGLLLLSVAICNPLARKNGDPLSTAPWGRGSPDLALNKKFNGFL